MSVTVTTASSERNLTTVSAVVGRLQLASVPAGMEQMVAAVSGAIERYCGRIFARQSYSETLNGNDSDTLVLSHSPIIGTPVVSSQGSPVVDVAVGDANTGFLYREVGWHMAAWIGWPDSIESAGDRVGSSYPLFTVDYTAGYKLPGEKDTDLPPDIQEAAIMTAMQWYRRGLRDPDVSSKKVGDLALTYGGQSDQETDDKYQGIPAMARALLPRKVFVA